MVRLNPPPPAYEPNSLFSNFTPDGKQALPSDAAQAEAQSSNTDRDIFQPLPPPQFLGHNLADKKKKPHPCAALFGFLVLIGFAIFFIYLIWRHQHEKDKVQKQWKEYCKTHTCY